MNPARDPLLDAITGANQACPDGHVLARLGSVVRDHSRPPAAVDLRERVRNAIATSNPETDSDDLDHLVDDYFDGDGRHSAAAAMPELQRLHAVVQEASVPPDDIDLLPALNGRWQDSSRRPIARLDPATRWRIWTAVIAIHVAATLAVAMTTINDPPDEPQAEHYDFVMRRPLLWRMDLMRMQQYATGRGGRVRIPEAPVSWSALQDRPADLFALRHSPGLRHHAREAFLMTGSAQTVESALRWLMRQQDVDSGAIGPLTGDIRHDLAVQSLASLALLGEGLDDDQRRITTRRCLNWILGRLDDYHPGHDMTVDGIVALALVEGALLLAEDDLALGAQQYLSRIPAEVISRPGSAGKEGFLLLALDTARLGRIPVPSRLISVVRDRIARSLPQREADIGRLGIAAFARQINGMSLAESTQRQIASISAQTPTVDRHHRSHPLTWFFAGLALREAGGEGWIEWSTALQRSLLISFRYTADDMAWLPGSRVAYAQALGDAGDVYATALALLNLQLPYRYLPLAMPQPETAARVL